jgi:hypothetical protein
MKWQEDLVQDIRFHDDRDDLDGNHGRFPEVPDRSFSVVNPVTGIDQTMSQCNIDAIIEHFSKIKDTCKCILEIGVDCNGTPTEMTSTRTFLDNKNINTVYLGVDIDDSSYLNNVDKNIYTLRTDSSNLDEVMQFLNDKGVSEIDFLFIDGWHSINQVLTEWEYTKFLSPNGIVGFHDTSIHPGPTMFVKYLDKKTWHVVENCCSVNENDYGIGFAWRK